jgi:hypothetical protein
LSDSIFDSFESRAAKFEQDLLFSFNISKLSLTSDFDSFLKMKSFSNQFVILMLSLTNFLSQCVVFLEYKPTWVYYQTSVAKFNELLVLNKSFVTSFQKACVVQLLYSLVLKKSTNDLTSLINKSIVKTNFTELKFFTTL